LSSASTEYPQHGISPFSLLVDRGGINGPLSASAGFFTNHIIQIVSLFQKRTILRVNLT
jgi:hypothetical protein